MITSALSSAFGWLTSPSVMWFWETVEAVTIIAVAIGCWGESWVDDDVFPFPKKKHKPLFARMIWISLAVEFFAFSLALIGSNKEIQSLKTKAEQLANDAANARRETAQIKDRAHDFAALTEVRFMTKTQRLKLERLLKSASHKGAISFAYRYAGPANKYSYFYSIRSAFEQSGFPIRNYWEQWTNSPVIPPPIDIVLFSRPGAPKPEHLYEINQAFSDTNFKSVASDECSVGTNSEIETNEVLIYVVEPHFDPQYHN